jgi:hypothetical protein
VVVIGQKFTNSSDWKDLIEQISLTYEVTAPKLLVDELKNAQISNQDIQDIVGDGRVVTAEAKNKYEQCYAKCTV